MAKQIAAYAIIVVIAIVVALIWRAFLVRSEAWKPVARFLWAFLLLACAVALSSLTGWLVHPWMFP